MFDITTGAVEHALRGLGMRTEVRANNVANATTPGFRGGRVDFEFSLRRALDRGARLEAPAVRPDPALPNGAGSTVSLETEMVGMLKDNLLRDAMVNAFNAKASVLRTAVTGGR
jgi:flagellar basal-body rod protein FlgB